jgi:hypothetical protein
MALLGILLNAFSTVKVYIRACMLFGFLGIALSSNQDAASFDLLEHRAVSFFWNESNKKTGLAKDRAANFKTQDDYNVSSCASTGFALAGYTIGVHRHWLNRTAALARTILTLRSLLEVNQSEHGWLYHFVDWESGKRMWNCEASSIDTSILIGGLIIAQQFWKDAQVDSLCKRFLARIDWKWMLTDGGAKPRELIFSMGWHPENGFIDARWTGYSEEKMLFLQGYGNDPNLNPGGFDKTNRVIVKYGGIDVITGGPLFMHEMSESFYSFKGMRDARGFNYFVATRHATLANRRYCIDNPHGFAGYGPGFWGLSACDTPDGYKALGAPQGEDDGTITPTSGIAALPYTPGESLSLMRSLLKDHRDALGRYGFSNGINPSKHWNDPDVIGIDLGMMLCGIENYRTGMIWKLSSSSPIVQLGMARMGFRKAPGSDSGPLVESVRDTAG